MIGKARMDEARVYVTLGGLLRLRHHAKGFSFLPRQPVYSLLAGRHASRLRGRGLDFEELRHYAEGDDTRTIDWSATARLGSPYVRIFTEERDRSVLLLVDQRLSMFFGSRCAMKSVIAAEAAALAAWRVTVLGDRIGAIIFSENGIEEIRPQGRNAGVMRILGPLVRFNNALAAKDERPSDPGLLNQALRRAAGVAKHDGLVCLITDAAGADAETVKLVTGLTAHNDVLMIFVSDPLESTLPAIGRAVVAEGPEQIEVNTTAAGLRRRFSDDFADRRDQIEHFSRRRAIPVLTLSTAADVSSQLREQLGRRLAPGRRAGGRTRP
ncbi:MoxR protein [Hyphomicrobiales bacterium]|nr:MoxR protein [Hyphomicrobiales bacterium]CAH1670451.1 MoxR protein [Hyphomicrobiales bacterium]